MPRFFRRSSTDESTITSTEASKFDFKKITTPTIVVTTLGVIVFLVGWQLFSAFKYVATSWPEIQFALEKPALVKSIREDYRSQQKSFEESFLKNNKINNEDAIVDKVLKKIGEEASLK